MKEKQIVDSYYVESNSKIYDIQRMFESLCVTEVSGIEDFGKAKNIITESYAESSDIRAYIPTSITFNTTAVTIELLFIGDKSEEEQILFNNFLVNNPMFTYYDTYRKRRASLLFNGGAKMSKDYRQLKGYEYGNALLFKYTFVCSHVDNNILTENELLDADMNAIKNISEYDTN